MGDYEQLVDGVTPGVDTAFVRDGTRPTVCRVGLGLTLYIGAPLTWERSGATEVFGQLVELAGRQRLRWYRTSMIPGWKRLPPEHGVEELREALAWSGRPRHHFRFRVADDRHAPEWGMTYRCIDPDILPRAGYLQLVLPQDANSDDLLQLALLIANKYPLLSGVGGFMAVWNEQERPTAFQEIWALSKRYLGLDVQVPDRFAFEARTSLPGTGWLTMIGHDLAAAVGIGLDQIRRLSWESDVRHIDATNALILRAGESPTLGDLNRLGYPSEYAEVSRTLEEHLLESPPELHGRFAADEATRAWTRRFLEPDGWR